MIKKQHILSVAILFSIFQNNFCMEERKLKAAHSKVEESDRLEKQKKISEEGKIDSIGEDTQELEEFRPFDTLPIELHFLFFEKELENIIHHNSIFTPLKGVKEFLDQIALVSKQSNLIAKDLGRNNCTSGENREPKYKIMVKLWFVPEEIRSLDQTSLNEVLEHMLILNQDEEQKIRTIEMHDSEFVKDERYLDFFKHLKNVCWYAAVYLIAGASPNLELSKNNQPLLKSIIEWKQMHALIPLLLVKKVNMNCVPSYDETPIMVAVAYPEVLKQLLEYDKSLINNVHDEYIDVETALCKAVCKANSKSLKMLLENGADTGKTQALAQIMEFADPAYDKMDEMSEEKLIESGLGEQILEDVRMAKLLIKYGADIEVKDPKVFTKHPIINQEWLVATKKIADIKKKIASINAISN